MNNNQLETVKRARDQADQIFGALNKNVHDDAHRVALLRKMSNGLSSVGPERESFEESDDRDSLIESLDDIIIGLEYPELAS